MKQSRDRRTFVLATVVATTLTWVAVVAVGRQIGPQRFAWFSATWGFYFAVAGILYGYQQVVTHHNASHSRQSSGLGRPRIHAMVVVGVGILAMAAALFWLPSPGSDRITISVTMGVGCSAYAYVSQVNGTLAGNLQWKLLSALVVLEAGLRLSFLSLAASLTTSNTLLAAGIVVGGLAWLPFINITPVRAALRSNSKLRLQATRVSQSMAISGLTALLLTGLPFLVVATAEYPANASLGSALAGIAVVRAPLFIVAGPAGVMIMAVAARSQHHQVAHLGPRVVVAAAACALLTWLNYAVGPQLLRTVFSDQFQMDGVMAAASALSSALYLIMTGSGTYLMARSGYARALVGWLGSLFATILALSISPDPTVRLCLALTVPPALGIATHIAFLRGANHFGHQWPTAGRKSVGS